MHILCITHAEFETPGVIQDWANARQHRFVHCQPYQGDKTPDISAFDMLIVMGGPQSPLSMDKAPYLADEIALIQRAIQHDKMVLGFCLGAQLLGEALGAKTRKSPEKEVGVFPITLTRQGENDPLLQGLPKHLPVIHWHNDMPGLTADADILAYSEGCPHQIIKYAPKLYGFQCHLEITLAGIQSMINACPDDLKTSQYTQTETQLLGNPYHEINDTMCQILTRIENVLHRTANEAAAS